MLLQCLGENQKSMSTRFADWLNYEMARKGWTQAELARKSKLSRQAINYYLGGKSKQPDEFALQKLAEAFQVPIEDAYRAAGIPVTESKQDRWVGRMESKLAQITDEDDRRTVEGMIDLLVPDKKARRNKRAKSEGTS